MKQRAPTFAFRLFMLLVVAALMVGVGLVWWLDGLSSVNTSDEQKRSFIIQKGEAVNTIATRLSAERFIRSKTVFFLYVKLNNLDSKIQAGNFYLSSSMSLEELTNALTVGTVDVWVTILEGWRSEEVAAKLAQELGVSEKEFLSVSREGYMFPDTYLFPKETSASAVVEVLQANFDKRLTAEMREEIVRQGRTIPEVVILASILEREGRTNTDKPVIAGVLLRRLKAGWPLDVDATLQYALGYQIKERTWWKQGLTNQDKLIASPYNTYKNTGLPPGPISNPGLSSLTAAIYPEESPYWFYLHDPEGQVHYARTIEEHNANIDKYLTY